MLPSLLQADFSPDICLGPPGLGTGVRVLCSAPSVSLCHCRLLPHHSGLFKQVLSCLESLEALRAVQLLIFFRVPATSKEFLLVYLPYLSSPSRMFFLMASPFCGTGPGHQQPESVQ